MPCMSFRSRLTVLAGVLASLLVPGLAAAACAPNATRLCLDGLRFQAEVSWTAPGYGSGAGQAVPLSDDSGSFWFFSNDNAELVVKVLDGRGVNGYFWVFSAGLSDVEYTLTVTDTLTGYQRTYHNPQGTLASHEDVLAFLGERPGPSASSEKRAPAAGQPSTLPVRLGPEFQVNGTAADSQVTPQVAMMPGGGFVAVWTNSRDVPADSDIQLDVRGRLFDASGHPRGDEFFLSQANAGRQILPKVAADAAGRFMTVWNHMNVPRARLFAADGHPLTGEIALGTGGFPDVAADPAGGFLVAWEETAAGSNRLHVQKFDSQGNRLGSGTQIDVPPGSLEGRLVLTASPEGGFLLAWDAFESVGAAVVAGIWAQPLNAAAQPVGTPVGVSVAGNVNGLEVTPAAGGGYAVVWSAGAGPFGSSSDYTLYARRLTAGGVPDDSAVEIRQGTWLATAPHSSLLLPSGDVWLLWFETGLPQDPEGGLFSQVFDPEWRPRSPATRLNTYTAGLQIEPALASGPGGIMAVWTSGFDHLSRPYPPDPADTVPQDGDGFGVFAQRLTPSTCALAAGELCLDGRFRVAVRFTDPRTRQAGPAQPVPLTSDSGAFWFFDAANVELIVKVLDGRSVNGHFWVYAGGLSDVAYTITVTDSVTGKSKTYVNPAHQLASRADTRAF